MRRVRLALLALAMGLGSMFALASPADAVCLQSTDGGGCGRCPNLKVIKVYCLQ